MKIKLNKINIKALFVILLLTLSFVSVGKVNAAVWVDTVPPWLSQIPKGSFWTDDGIGQDSNVTPGWWFKSNIYMVNDPATVPADCDASCGVMSRKCTGVLPIKQWDIVDSEPVLIPGLLYVCSEDKFPNLKGMTWTTGEFGGGNMYEEACKSISRILDGAYSTSIESPYGGVALCKNCKCGGDNGRVSCGSEGSNTGGAGGGGWPPWPPSNVKPEDLSCIPASIDTKVEKKVCDFFVYGTLETNITYTISKRFSSCEALGGYHGSMIVDGKEHTIENYHLTPNEGIKCHYDDEGKDAFMESLFVPEVDSTTEDYSANIGFDPVSVSGGLPAKTKLSWYALDEHPNCRWLYCEIAGPNFSTTVYADPQCESNYKYEIEGEKDLSFDRAGSYTYSISCHNPSSNGGCRPDEKVSTFSVPEPPPTVTVTANPTFVGHTEAPGGSNLTWNSTYANSCISTWAGNSNPSGSQLVTRDLNAKEDFPITCSGSGGSTTASTTVEFKFLPSISFSTIPAAVNGIIEVPPGQNVFLEWSSKNALFCNVAGVPNDEAGSGSISVPMGDSSTTIQCRGAGGSTTKTIVFHKVPTGLIFTVQ